MKTKLLDQSAPRGDQFHLSGSAILAVVFMALSSTMFVDVLAAQGVFGRISGAVTDSQGGAIAGAKISIVNEDTKLTRSTTTDANGYYVASDLPVGLYSVIAEQAGFKLV